MRDRGWRLAVVVFGLAGGVALLATVWMMGRAQGSGSFLRPSDAQKAETLVLSTLRKQISDLQDRIRAIETARNLSPESQREVSLLKEGLAEVELQARSMGSHFEREDHLVDVSARAASQAVDTAAGMIEFLSVLFTVVLFGVSLVVALNVRSLHEDLRESQTAIGKQLSEVERAVETEREALASERQTLSDQVGRLKDESDSQLARLIGSVDIAKESLVRQEEKLDGMVRSLDERERASRDFLGELAEVHSSAFTELLGPLAAEGMLPAAVASQLRDKGIEFHGKLLLWHPDPARKEIGVRELGARGSKGAIVDLGRLIRDERTGKELAVLAQIAIEEIRKREGLE